MKHKMDSCWTHDNTPICKLGINVQVYMNPLIKKNNLNLVWYNI